MSHNQICECYNHTNCFWQIKIPNSCLRVEAGMEGTAIRMVFPCLSLKVLSLFVSVHVCECVCVFVLILAGITARWRGISWPLPLIVSNGRAMRTSPVRSKLMENRCTFWFPACNSSETLCDVRRCSLVTRALGLHVTIVLVLYSQSLNVCIYGELHHLEHGPAF